jgi:hypothetical protein
MPTKEMLEDYLDGFDRDCGNVQVIFNTERGEFEYISPEISVLDKQKLIWYKENSFSPYELRT